MEQEYLSWGNGLKKSDIMNQREFNIIKNDFGTKFDNIYIKDDCILYIVKGELYKKGLLEFEKSEEYKEVKKSTSCDLVNLFSSNGQLAASETIVDLALGDNHILIRTLKGNVYSWGDNYYGQLGIGNFFMAKVYEPLQVKVRNIQEIYAYKNNSFALDSSGKLWVWGKNEYLGCEVKANAFSPRKILSHYNILKLKISDDRIIVIGTEDIGVTGNKVEKPVAAASTRQEAPITEETHEEHKPEEEEIKKVKSRNNDDSNKALINQILKVFGKVNLDVGNILSRFTIAGGKGVEKKDDIGYEEKVLRGIREKVLSDKLSIKQMGLEQVWTEISRLINNPTDNAKGKALLKKQEQLNSNEAMDLLMITFTAFINGSFNEFNINKLIDNFAANEKEITKMINDINLSEGVNDLTLLNLVDNIKTLLTYFIKYKKLEMMIHKMSGHQFLLKSFHFENVLEGLQFILNQDQSVDKKLYLIEKTFNNLKFLIDKTNESFKGLNSVYDNISNFNYSLVSDNAVEKFMHKHIIESTFYIRDLWELLIENVERHKKSTEKENQLFKILEIYKELNSIHMYLNTVSVVNIFKSESKGIGMINISLNNELKTRIILLITQIDGAITKIESIMKKQLEKPSDAFTNVN